MSLDVYLTDPEPTTEECICSQCDNKHTHTFHKGLFHYNITHNLGVMATEAGIYEALWRPEEIGIQTASQLIPLLTTGLAKLKREPLLYKMFNPNNGWGSYEGLVKFVEEYLAACKEYPKAIVRVWR